MEQVYKNSFKIWAKKFCNIYEFYKVTKAWMNCKLSNISVMWLQSATVSNLLQLIKFNKIHITLSALEMTMLIFWTEIFINFHPNPISKSGLNRNNNKNSSYLDLEKFFLPIFLIQQPRSETKQEIYLLNKVFNMNFLCKTPQGHEHEWFFSCILFWTERNLHFSRKRKRTNRAVRRSLS